MIGSQLAHYRILGPLGQGGMAEVYRAQDMRLGREIALKILPKALASRAEEVARLYASTTTGHVHALAANEDANTLSVIASGSPRARE